MIGVDAQRSQRVLSLLRQITSGSIESLQGSNNKSAKKRAHIEGDFVAPRRLNNIIVGSAIATNLNLHLNDSLRLISPLLSVLTPLGLQPRSLGYRVSGIFDSKLYDYDSRYAYCSLTAARRFLQLDADDISGWHVLLRNANQAGPIAAAIRAQLPSERYIVSDWQGRNETLFAALNLERMLAFVVLAFIILVASFAIVNTLTLSILEKRQEISILKTMGARDESVINIFVIQGVLIGSLGAVCGALLGVGVLAFLKYFGLGIPSDIYYIDSLS